MTIKRKKEDKYYGIFMTIKGTNYLFETKIFKLKKLAREYLLDEYLDGKENIIILPIIISFDPSYGTK